MKTYCVTGGAGFIGSNFILHLYRKYGNQVRIINVDKLTYASNLDYLCDIEHSDQYHFHQTDICDADAIDQLFATYDIDYVVNFAAESHVDRSIADSSTFIQSNIVGAQVLLDAARKAWFCDSECLPGKRFLQVSTDEVYGSLGVEGAFTEDTPLHPNNPYAASKASADLLVQSYYHTYGLPVNITRCSNNYGPNQYPEKLIPLMIHHALAHQPMPVYGDGQQVREWIHVDDHVAAIDLIVTKALPGEVYNIGSNQEKANLEIVHRIIDILHTQLQDECIRPSLIQFVTDRLGHDRRYAIDAGRIMKDLGWKPRVLFEEGFRETVAWYMSTVHNAYER